LTVLQRRLLDQVRLRLCNGELTERRLARMAGISQPHMHNVLKGVRSLTPEVADLLLASLGLSMLDMIAPDEARALLESQYWGHDAAVLAPVANDPIGPGHPFPSLTEARGWLRLPASVWAGRRRLALAPLAHDPDSPVDAGHQLALLCLDEAVRLRVAPGQTCLLRWRGSGFLRHVRVEAGAVIVLQSHTSRAEAGPEVICLDEEGPLQAVRGTVIWTGADFRSASPLDYMGSFLENPASR
jgi:hypothetical protein